MEFTYTLKNGATRTGSFSSDDLDAFCGPHIGEKWVREQVSFMAMGFSGMVEHSYMSRDWIAHNGLHVSAYNKIVDIVGVASALEISNRMDAAAGRHACAATGR